MGPEDGYALKQPLSIIYDGPGKTSTLGNRPISFVIRSGNAASQYATDPNNPGILYHIGDPQCFPAGTCIRLPSGATRNIEQVVIGTEVATFLEGVSTPLVSGKVVRVFQGLTDTWVRLSNGLVTTPGHHFLTPAGKFLPIGDILWNESQIVLENGCVINVTGAYIRYSEETAELFEEAEGYLLDTEGSAAVQPRYKRGWRTYNFEVEDFHTYVAGGVRVHNQSVIIGSGKDVTVGQYHDRNGHTINVKADGTVTDADTGYTAPAPKGHLSSNPENPYDDRNFTIPGTGPAVTLASGTVVNAGTKLHTGGYDYIVDDKGDVINTDTHRVTAPAGTPIPPPLPGNEPSGPTTVVQQYEAAGDSPSQAYSDAAASAVKSQPNGDPHGNVAGVSTTGYNLQTGGQGGNNASANATQSPGGSLTGSQWPVILDLTGDGIDITPLSSSDTFLKVDDDGQQHRTAWAGAGNGVLVLDADNNGAITQGNEVDFTDWDPTAKTDMDALRAVFDTNHDGALDSGDTDWSEFKVLVTNADGTTTMETLSALGITSINLTSNNQELDLPDGSGIIGETTYTKSGGGTGTVADATLSYDKSGYVVASTVTNNADGSTTIDNKADNADGSLASETIQTISADGKTKTLKFDDDGDGVIDRTQTDATVTNGDGSTTETLSNYDNTGTILTSKQVTTTSADKKTVTIDRDFSGSGSFDQSETDVTAANGSLTVTVTDLHRDGSTKDNTTTVTSADGLTKTVQTQLTGSGVVNNSESDTTVVGGTGIRTETVKDYAGSAMSAASMISQTITTTSADGSSRTIAYDLDGNATTDLTATSTIVHNTDGSTTTTTSDTNANGSLRTKMAKQVNADGNTTTTQIDADGNGAYDTTTVDAIVHNTDGSTTETVTDKNGNGTERDQTVSTWSADGKTRTDEVDADGDGGFNSIETVAVVSGSSVDTLSNYSPNGATLVSKVVTTTSADGLTQTMQTDANGDGTYDLVQASTTVVNADHSSTVTSTEKNGAGTVQIGKTVVSTSANGLSTTTQTYLDAQTTAYQETTDVLVKNSDGSTTETVTNFAGTSAVQVGKTVTTLSADRLTTTVQNYLDSDTAAYEVDSTTTSSSGLKTETVSNYTPDGATLVSKMTTTVSADGLTTTATVDANGDGVTDSTQVSAVVYNTSGSTTTTTTSYQGSGTAAANESGQMVVTVSGNALSTTTQVDSDGDGTFDSKTTDVMVLNSDGSKTETVTNYNGSGSVVVGKTVTTTSGNGLSTTISSYLGGDATADHISTDVTVLNSDGSTVETDTEKSANGSVVSKTVTTTSASGQSVTVAADLDGNGVDDIVSATITAAATGSVTDVTSTYNSSGTLTSKSAKTVSASGLSTTIATDLDGNGTTDLSSSDVTVLNADGSRAETISDFKSGGALKDKTVVTTSADGLSVTTQWDDTGAGSVGYSSTDVTTINADGSKTEVLSHLNGSGALHDKTTQTTSADGATTTTTVDTNGDGTVDQTVVQVVNADGSVLTSSMDGTVESASGRKYGSINGRYKTVSANGLSTTTQYDGNGDGLAESQTTDVTVLNGSGTTTETITDSALSGGSATSANPAYTATTKDKTVVTTSANGLSTTTHWDLTGSGTFTESSTDVTTMCADGSKTETVSYFSGDTLTSRRAVTTSADGLTVTTQWDPTGLGFYSQTETDVTTINADGSKTESVSDAGANGGIIATSVTTTSADGRSSTTQLDPLGTGSATQSQSESDVRLADGSTIDTISDLVGGSLRDKTTTQTSADGLTTTITRDANGDGVTDQTEVDTRYVDGSGSTVITDLSSSGAIAAKVTANTSADGLLTTSQRDFNGNGIIDQTSTDTLVDNADGSSVQTIQVYQTSHLVSGVETAMSPVLLKTTKIAVSADGKVRTTTVDVDGNGSTDQTTTTTTKADGSTVTTVSNDIAARNVSPDPGEVLWNSAIATSDKTVAAASTTTTSADGLTKTVAADYDGNGTYEHTEVWHAEIDGSQLGTISDANASGVVVAKGYETISADGTTVTLLEDTTDSGRINREDTSVTHIDGSKTETVTTLNSNGTLNQRVVTKVSANGQSASSTTTNGPGTTFTYSDSNTTHNIFGSDGVVSVGGNSDTIVIGNAVDTVSLSGGNNVVHETADGFLTVTSTGSGNLIEVSGNQDVVNASSMAISVDDDSGVTLSGSNDVITVYDNTKVNLTAGTGDTLDVSGVDVLATISSATVNVWDDASLDLTGTQDSVQLSDNDSVNVSSGTDLVNANGTGANVADVSGGHVDLGENASATVAGNDVIISALDGSDLTATGSNDSVAVNGTNVSASLSYGEVTLDSGASLTLDGTVNNVYLNDDSSVTTSTNSDWYDVEGTGVSIDSVGGADVYMGADGTSATIAGGNDSLVVNGTNVSASLSYGEATLDSGASLTLDGTVNNIYLNDDSSVTTSTTSDWYEVEGTGVSIDSGGGADVYMGEDGTSATIAGGNDSLAVDGANVSASLSDGEVTLDSGASLTLDGTANNVYLNDDSSVTTSTNSDWYDVDGTGTSIDSGGGANVYIENDASATVADNDNSFLLREDDVLTATGINNAYSFDIYSGNDTIYGFNESGSTADEVDVSSQVFSDWAQLLSASSQSGSDVIITAPSGDTVTLKDTTLAGLQQSHFHFT
jgi:hypothetical protein